LTFDDSLRPQRLPLARLVGLVALLGVDLAMLMLRFSTESLAAAGHEWWADTLWRWKIVLPPLAIAMSTAAVLLGGDRLRAELRRPKAVRATKLRWVTAKGGLPPHLDLRSRAAMHEWLNRSR